MSYIHVDFTGAHSTTLRLKPYPARIANWIRRKIGNKAMLAICRRLPISKPSELGLLVWSRKYTYTAGQWALCWHEENWHAFIVARANTDAQLRCFREGGLTYHVEQPIGPVHA